MSKSAGWRVKTRLLTYSVVGAAWLLQPVPGYGAGKGKSQDKINISAPDAISPVDVGVAAFRRMNYGVIVLAAPVPVDVMAIRAHAGFAGARVQFLPDATAIVIPIQRTDMLSLASGMASWTITIRRKSKHFDSAASFIKAGHIEFPLAKTGSSLAVADPVTKGTLLVGTVTGAGAERSAIRGPGYASLPTWRGVAVRALSDELSLKAISPGFVLNDGSADPGAQKKIMVSPAMIAGAGMSRSFSFPAGTVTDLRHGLERAQVAVAEAPPLDQLSASLRLARVLLALGMGPEAHGVLQNALRSDPASKGNQTRIGLLAVADALDGRPQAASLLKSLTAAPTTETGFWLSVARIRRKAAVKNLANGVDLLLSYPQPLRDELAPEVAEALVAGHQLPAAQKIFNALPDDARLGLPRAQALEAAHQDKEALAAYQALRRSDDPRIAGIATTKVILMRYRMHQIDAKAAASELSSQLYSWRGPHHELHARLALARLRAKAGAWAQALHGLDRALSLLPEGRPELQAERRRLFDRMISSGAIDRLDAMSAIDAIQENEDLVPAGVAGAPVLHVLAGRLMALDLPGLAAPVLKDLISRADTGASRARLGLALAQVDMEAGSIGGAAEALADTNAPDLPGALVARRHVVEAEIHAQGGHVPLALASLKKSDDADAMKLESRLELEQHQWHPAESTLEKLAATTIPASGRLTRREAHLVAQLAGAASEANDAPELAALRAQYKGRFPPGQDADLFATITMPPLDSGAGLSSALKQIAAIERLGAGLSDPASEPSSKAAGQ